MRIIRNLDYKKDRIILFLLVVSPILYFSYNIFPKNEEFQFFNFTINAGYYELFNIAIWNFYNNFLIAFLLSMWFLTCKHWWRYLILISIAFELNKLFLVVHYMKNLGVMNKSESLILIIPGIMGLLFLSKKLNYYSRKISLNNQVDTEIDELMLELSKFKSNNYNKFRQKLNHLRLQKDELAKREYLAKLIQLRYEFTSKT